MEAPAPGVYEDVPFEDYLAWKAASNSRLSKLARSAAHLREYLDKPIETAALRVGRAVHAAVFERERFEREYSVAGACEAELSSGKRKGEECGAQGSYQAPDGRWICGRHRAAESAEEPTSAVLTESDHDSCVGVLRAIDRCATASRLLAPQTDTRAELSMVWDDELTGVRCKGRLDLYQPSLLDGVVVDLKTTRDASPQTFPRDAYNYGYHRQGAFYLSGLKALGLPAERHVVIAAEKVPPFGVGTYLYEQGALDIGWEPIPRLLTRWKECMERDVWPGYPDQVLSLALPHWAYTQTDDHLEEVA